MRKYLHIATLGVHHNILVEYVITRRGADKVALIYTERNEDDLMAIRKEIEENLVEVIAKKVSPWDYHEVLSAILEIVAENEEYEIEYNVSCGTRVMTAAAYLAALFTDSSVYFVKSTEKEEIGDIIMVQPFSVALLSEPKKIILRKIEEGGGSFDSQSMLGSRADLKASSISKHLNTLEDAGYIIRTRHGRKTRVEITDLGRIVLNLKAFRKGKVWGVVDANGKFE
jgi:CRISPR locus-related DNA-binding protein